ncbi:MAG: AAA family ATPase [Candidatus Nanoarchaeia archaeon]
MGLFDGMLRDSESLFLNTDALDPDFIPKLIPHRENETKYIAECIKPLFQKRSGRNLFVTGKPGIGKTVAIKHIFKELEQKTDDIIPFYINCWKKNTMYKIVLDICDQVGYKWVQNRKADELWHEVVKLINKKSAVFCFDEVDKLEDVSILYSVADDVYRKVIILVTNDKSWFFSLDSRIRSRLIPDSLEFRPYNYNETEDILAQRRDYAFVRNVWSDDAFQVVVEHAHKFQDIRTGLFLMRESANFAEMASSRRVLIDHAHKAVSKIPDFKIRSTDALEDEERDILRIIKEHSGKSATDIYNVYKSSYDKSYRTFQRKVSDLEKAGLISVKEAISDKGGKQSIIFFSVKNLSDFK